jgi:hypothetical protein
VTCDLTFASGCSLPSVHWQWQNPRIPHTRNRTATQVISIPHLFLRRSPPPSTCIRSRATPWPPSSIAVLVIAPTRELAGQIHAVCSDLCSAHPAPCAAAISSARPPPPPPFFAAPLLLVGGGMQVNTPVPPHDVTSHLHGMSFFSLSSQIAITRRAGRTGDRRRGVGLQHRHWSQPPLPPTSPPLSSPLPSVPRSEPLITTRALAFSLPAL